ncbi:hypothetical protein VHUM_01744 [Vanrija humicola]|uniref:Alcohol dehydrogenase-like C-terminal domain-containing protein n=1 Tax=Vanrija humicola TaxID=5417 RepID=A0A7D8V2G1_VANHU|nr:hypothetical protein VHUM_01744 [Vanrija humicola]
MAIQLAKMMGYRVATAASPRNHDLVKSYGAELAFDYRSPTVVDDILAATGGGVPVAFDAIAEDVTIRISLAVTAQGGKLYGVLPASGDIKAARPDVEVSWPMNFTLFGKAYTFGFRDSLMEVPAAPGDREFLDVLIKRAPELFEAGLRGLPYEVRGGLADLPAGMQDLKSGKVSRRPTSLQGCCVVLVQDDIDMVRMQAGFRA